MWGEEAREGQTDPLLFQGQSTTAHEGSDSLGHTSLACALEGAFGLSEAGITVTPTTTTGGGSRDNGLEQL
jgi:hypothetical protein